MNDLNCIYIKNFSCPASIGLYDHEKNISQTLVLHLELYSDWSKTPFIDYDRVITQIKNVIHQAHYDLLESLAENIANRLFTCFPIQRLILAIDKPQAVSDALVGVKIERFA